MPWEVPLTIDGKEYKVRIDVDREPTKSEVTDAVVAFLKQREKILDDAVAKAREAGDEAAALKLSTEHDLIQGSSKTFNDSVPSFQNSTNAEHSTSAELTWVLLVVLITAVGLLLKRFVKLKNKIGRTLFASLVCVVLTLAYSISTNQLFGWRFGGGGIHMGIWCGVLCLIWSLIRGDRTNRARPTSQRIDASPTNEIEASSSFSESQKCTPPATIAGTASEPEKLPAISAYELLVAEKEKGFRHEALWLKCFSEADGDLTRAEAAYNRERASMLASKASEGGQALS